MKRGPRARPESASRRTRGGSPNQGSSAEDERGRTRAGHDGWDGDRPYAGRHYLLGSLRGDNEELEELGRTLGMLLLAEVVQPRERAHASTFFGKGRVAAMAGWLRELDDGEIPVDWVAAGDRWVPVPTASGVQGNAAGAQGRLDENGASGRRRSVAADAGWPGVEVSAPRGEVGSDPLVSTGTGTQGVGRSQAKREGARGDSVAPPAFDPARDEAPLLVLAEDVKPSVLFNLQEHLGVEVWDRTRLILEIFSAHAHVKEARLQVELAKLQYEVPLIREAIHRKRSGERPGFMGGGEYDVADYQDFIKRRMGRIKDELERIRKERGVRRGVRREGFYLVSLAGYTNAGKSSLLNRLTGAGVVSEWEMFSTLATTTRKMVDPRPGAESARIARGAPSVSHGGGESDIRAAGANRTNAASDAETRRTKSDAHVDTDQHRPVEPENRYQRPVLVTDTVGFIAGLPSWLLEAFHSTLEEISVSDVVLLVADLSDDLATIIERLQVCHEELAFLEVTCPVIVVLNKMDLVSSEQRTRKLQTIMDRFNLKPERLLVTSTGDGAGLPELRDAIDRALPGYRDYSVALPYDDAGQRVLSLLFDMGWVHTVDYGSAMTITGSCDRLHWRRLLEELAGQGFGLSS